MSSVRIAPQILQLAGGETAKRAIVFSGLDATTDPITSVDLTSPGIVSTPAGVNVLSTAFSGARIELELQAQVVTDRMCEVSGFVITTSGQRIGFAVRVLVGSVR